LTRAGLTLGAVTALFLSFGIQQPALADKPDLAEAFGTLPVPPVSEKRSVRLATGNGAVACRTTFQTVSRR
jgi:hypothetical protein